MRTGWARVKEKDKEKVKDKVKVLSFFLMKLFLSFFGTKISAAKRSKSKFGKTKKYVLRQAFGFGDKADPAKRAGKSFMPPMFKRKEKQKGQVLVGECNNR